MFTLFIGVLMAAPVSEVRAAPEGEAFQFGGTIPGGSPHNPLSLIVVDEQFTPRDDGGGPFPNEQWKNPPREGPAIVPLPMSGALGAVGLAVMASRRRRRRRGF